MTFVSVKDFQNDLDIFRFWYNETRPHQNLKGLTPKEAWQSKRYKRKSKPVLVSAWDGILTGYYFPD